MLTTLADHGTTYAQLRPANNAFADIAFKSARLEHHLQTRLRVVGIIDPAVARGEAVLEHKANSFVAMAYSDCRLCKNLDEFVKGMKPTDTPHAIIIGSPPAFHGSDLWAAASWLPEWS